VDIENDSGSPAEIRTLSTRTWLDGAIVMQCALPGSTLEVGEVEELLQAIRGVSGGRERPGLIDVRPGRRSSHAARRRLLSAAGTAAQAVALVVGPGPTRVVAGLLLRLSPPSIPIQLFETVEEGRVWLVSLLAAAPTSKGRRPIPQASRR